MLFFWLLAVVELVACSRYAEQKEQLFSQQSLSAFDKDAPRPRHSNTTFAGDYTGSSPFFYCEESDPENDNFVIDHLVLNPNPPYVYASDYLQCSTKLTDILQWTSVHVPYSWLLSGKHSSWGVPDECVGVQTRR